MKLPQLPPPTSFAEGQRMVFGCLVAFAGIFCGGCAIAMIALLMWGNWSKSEEHTIVVIFGWSLGGFIASMLAVILALSVGGPVGRFKMGVGTSGANFESESAAAASVAQISTTTTVSAPPTAPPKPSKPPPGESEAG